MKTFQYNIMKVRDNNGNYIEFPSIAQKDPITLKANLTTTESGYALDASMGYTLDSTKVNKNGDDMTGPLSIYSDTYAAFTVANEIGSLWGRFCVIPSRNCPMTLIATDRNTHYQSYFDFNPNDVNNLFCASTKDASSVTQNYTFLHTGNYQNYYYNSKLNTLDSGNISDVNNWNVSGAAWRLPILNASARNGTDDQWYYSTGLRIGINNTTTSANGLIQLTLGNSTASSSAQGFSGRLTLYGDSTYCSTLRSTEATTNRVVYLPYNTSSDSCYIVGVFGSRTAGSATRPVYVTNSGITQCDLGVVCSDSEPSTKYKGLIWLKPVS